MMNEIELKVKGMSCAHCEMRVKKALEKVDGVKKVNVDHKKGRAWVTLDEGSELDSQKLVEAVNATEVYEATT
jgi:copper chaperone CopZ